MAVQEAVAQPELSKLRASLRNTSDIRYTSSMAIPVVAILGGCGAMANRINAKRVARTFPPQQLSPEELDQYHFDRVKKVSEAFRRNGELRNEDLFVSERVADTVDRYKLLLSSYQQEQILAALPFYETICVLVCPVCVGRSDANVFKKLVEYGAIVPIFFAPYKSYDSDVISFISAQDHISCYEFDFFRHVKLRAINDRGLCPHCVKQRVQNISKAVAKEKNGADYKRLVRTIQYNLAPFVYPDFTLLEQLQTATDERNFRAFREVVSLSFGIRQIRAAQILSSPAILKSDEIAKLPRGLTNESDYALSAAAATNKFIADGLGLKVPVTSDIERYVEIVSDFRPRLKHVINQVEHSTHGNSHGASASLATVQREIMKLNDEIVRIKNLRRTSIMEAGISFYRNHPQMVLSGLLLSAFGLAGSLTGCGATVAVQAVRAAAKKVTPQKPSQTPNRAVQRLKERVRQDIQPSLDKLLATYVGSNRLAVNVMSLRRAIATAANSNSQSSG